MAYKEWYGYFKESCDSLVPPVPCPLPGSFSEIKNSVLQFAGVIGLILDAAQNLPRQATISDLAAAVFARGNSGAIQFLQKAFPGLTNAANARLWAARNTLPPGFGASGYTAARVGGQIYASYVAGAWAGALIYATWNCTMPDLGIQSGMAGVFANYYEAGGLFNMLAGNHNAVREGQDLQMRLAIMKKIKLKAQRAGAAVPASIAAKIPAKF